MDSMETITEKLSEIEKAASAIVESAEEKKHSLEQGMQEKRNQFDAELEAKTQEKLEKIRTGLQTKMNQLLKEQEEQNAKAIEILKVDFQRHHTDYAKKIMARITEVKN
ncbi:MAG: hypothetical protein MR380_01995 [Lachnospiraceae bacterium]|nr:hypothetical protein [Lachnospiraceae bacterium]